MAKLGDRKDLLGREFGLWTVIGDAPDVFEGRNQVRVRVLYCRCVCGKVGQVRLYLLNRGRSLGCPKCRKRTRDDDLPLRALELYQEGFTYRGVALKLGVCKQYVWRLLKEARDYCRGRKNSHKLKYGPTSTKGK